MRYVFFKFFAGRSNYNSSSGVLNRGILSCSIMKELLSENFPVSATLVGFLVPYQHSNSVLHGLQPTQDEAFRSINSTCSVTRIWFGSKSSIKNSIMLLMSSFRANPSHI